MKVDLHCHTTASDGTLTPKELLDLAQKQELQMLAITDHDTTAGYEEAKDLMQDYDFKLISGVEISVMWQNRTIHLVGLNVDVEHQGLQDLLAKIRNLRWQRVAEINSKLMKRGHKCMLQELEEIVGVGVVARPHVAQVLINRGYVQTQNQAFDKFLKTGRVGFAKAIWPDLSEALDMIHQAGGVGVVAHPALYNLTRRKLNLMLEEFAELGGQGLEVVTSPYNTSEAIGMTDRANRYGLYASLGSDFHSPEHTWRNLGWLAPLPADAKPIYQLF